jgi:siroheme synthase
VRTRTPGPHVHVGKRSGRRSFPQELATRLLVRSVRRGAVVARLKGGDPFVFGRGGEEALALARAGLPFEIVPGVTSALGAAAYAGIPLTHRGIASSVAFIAGRREGGGPVTLDVAADTLVVFMCQHTIHRIARELVAKGRAAAMPVALVRGASWSEQEVYTDFGELAMPDDDWYVTSTRNRRPEITVKWPHPGSSRPGAAASPRRFRRAGRAAASSRGRRRRCSTGRR